MKQRKTAGVQLMAILSMLLAISACTELTSSVADDLDETSLNRVVHRPLNWSVHDLPWPGGVSSQLQSVYPLDDKGDLVLVGGLGYEHTYVVFDLSSGSPVAVAGSGRISGYKTAAHSPLNSTVGFGGGQDQLVKYDDGFVLEHNLALYKPELL